MFKRRKFSKYDIVTSEQLLKGLSEYGAGEQVCRDQNKKRTSRLYQCDQHEKDIFA